MEEGCWSPKTSLDDGLSPHPESPVPAGLPCQLEFQKEGTSLEQGDLGTTFSFPFYPGQGPAEEGNKLDCGVWVCVFRRNWSSSPHYFLVGRGGCSARSTCQGCTESRDQAGPENPQNQTLIQPKALTTDLYCPSPTTGQPWGLKLREGREVVWSEAGVLGRPLWDRLQHSGTSRSSESLFPGWQQRRAHSGSGRQGV